MNEQLTLFLNALIRYKAMAKLEWRKWVITQSSGRTNYARYIAH